MDLPLEALSFEATKVYSEIVVAMPIVSRRRTWRHRSLHLLVFTLSMKGIESALGVNLERA